MTKIEESLEDFIITIDPDAPPEEVERFLNELARVIIILAKHRVEMEDEKSSTTG